MGKQIRIYLSDGSPSGIRHAEITNWTGQALACPRSRFQELREWQEAKRPGIYFLFGQDEETGENEVYIGEAEIVAERLANHINGKDFWSELIAFTSKDDNLTKGHVRYLESRLIQMALTAGRYKITNMKEQQLPALPRPDRDAMEEYLESTRILLGVLGHRLLDPLVTARKQSSTIQAPTSPNNSVAVESQSAVIFKLRISNLISSAIRTDEGLVVLEGSDAAKTSQTSLSGGYRNLRDKLIQQDILVSDGTKLKFTKNHLFNSPSQAAAVIVGYAINGRDAWKLPDGTTYSGYENSESQQLLKELNESFQVKTPSMID